MAYLEYRVSQRLASSPSPLFAFRQAFRLTQTCQSMRQDPWLRSAEYIMDTVPGR